MYKIVFLSIVCALTCLSGDCKKEIAHEYTINVQHGDTFNALIEPYYSKCTTGISWAEYQYRQRKLNDDLFKNQRALQISDTILVQFYTYEYECKGGKKE